MILQSCPCPETCLADSPQATSLYSSIQATQNSLGSQLREDTHQGDPPIVSWISWIALLEQVSHHYCVPWCWKPILKGSIQEVC